MTQATSRRRRRLPRMRIAALLILVAAVGGPAGWYIHGVRVQRQTVRALRDAGAIVVYDWEWEQEWNPAGSFRSNGQELAGWRRAVAERFGPDAVASVASVTLPRIRGGEDPRGATDEHIELIGRLKSLRELQLTTFTVTEAGAAPIAGLKQLRAFVVLDRRGKSEIGPILSRFGEDSPLERLTLIGPVIDNEDIDVPTDDVDSAPAIDDEDCAAISRLSRLEVLQIDGGPGKIGDAGMAGLARLERLKTLRLPQTRITTEGLKPISRMKSLETVAIEGSSIDDLAPFLQLPLLNDLRLGDCRVGDEALSALGEMRGLKRLSLESNLLTDAGLAHLRNMPALQSLSLESESITAAGLESLAAIKTLEWIGLSDCEITPEEESEFAESHPGIILFHYAGSNNPAFREEGIPDD